jgi:thiosulfate dehydrogenase
MKSNKVTFTLVIIAVFCIIGACLTLFFRKFIEFNPSDSIATSAPQKKQIIATATFNAPDPRDASEDIKEAVMLGYNMMTDTRKYAAGYVGNKLDCDNCHFNGGITEGGKNGGLSLVGVAATYPKYRKGLMNVEDLVTRTNDCFEKSMNGKPLPADSKEMIAIITYFQWISKGLPIYADIPWLGIKNIKSKQITDPANGKKVFTQQCAICHGNIGEGTLSAPPLWGRDSFNDGAGMHKPENMAVFAYNNMPRTNPDLTVEQSAEVAAFVSVQPRPHFVARKK